MEKKFYVYIHRRTTDGRVFYVGKGARDRAYSSYSRNKWWYDVVGKHGFSVHIVKDKMSEKCAYTLEKIIIGVISKIEPKLVNQKSGGEGNPGPSPKMWKPVGCSNGMEFKSVGDAAKWAGITAGKISAACRGKRLTAGGFAWAYKGSPIPEYECPRERVSVARSKPVTCSNGLEFGSAKKASDWLRETIGVKNARSNICYAIAGKIKTAYGFEWKFKE